MNWNEYLHYEDGELFSIAPRKGVKIGKKVGNIHKTGYVMFRFDYKLFYVHRVIWEMHNCKIPDGLFVDHIDRDKTNNRIENLRLATPKENSRNNSANGFCWIRKRNSFLARIFIDGKQKNLGLYKTIIDARAAYLQARREHFGEFA